MSFLDYITSKINPKLLEEEGKTNPFTMGVNAKTVSNTPVLKPGVSPIRAGFSAAVGTAKDILVKPQVKILSTAKDLATGVTEGFMRFGLSATEAALQPGAKLTGTKVEIPTLRNPYLEKVGIGPIETYQSEARRKVAEGYSPTKAILTTAGKALIDEPVGVALKPIGLAAGFLFKSKAGQTAIKAIAKSEVTDDIVKTIKGSELYDTFKNVFKDKVDDVIRSSADDLKNIKTPEEVSRYITSKLDEGVQATKQAPTLPPELAPKQSALERLKSRVPEEAKVETPTNVTPEQAALDRLKARTNEGVVDNVQKQQTLIQETPTSPTGESVSPKTSTLKSTGEALSTLELPKEKVSLSENIPHDFNVDKYVKEQIAAREKARTTEKIGIIDKTKSFLANVKKKMVEFAAPIEDTLYDASKKSKFSLLPEYNITNQIDRTLRAPTLAGQFARDNGLEKVIQDVENLDVFDQYLIAKHAIELDSRGITTGRDIVKDTALVKSLAPEYEQYAKVISNYSQKLLDYSVESGLISKDLADILRARYPDYVPFQRVFSELENINPINPSGRGIASLSKQTIVQKIEGSTREIESPIESLLTKTNDAFMQGEKNKAAQILTSYEKLPGNPFQLRPLQTAEKVQERTNILTKLKETFSNLRNEKRISKTVNKQVNKIQQQIDKQTTKLEELIDVAITKAADFDWVAPESLKKFQQMEIRIQKLIEKPDFSFSQELKNLISERETLIKELRTSLVDTAKLKPSTTENTITLFKNGIKETWATTPEIAQAAKALNVQQMNILGKILALPVRVARVGITGINIPFVGANVAKDQVSAFINSNHGLATSVLNPKNFIKSLFSAVKHDALYEEMVRAGGAGTSFDIARNQVNQTVGSIRAGKNIKTRVSRIVAHPIQSAEELLRFVENIIARGEELTRLQQYSGTKKVMLKKGYSELSATTEAARQAREATVNFARRGEWGTVLNNTFLYLNANIQGTRTLLRNLKTKPVQTTAKIVASTFVPVAAITAWNLNDEKRREIYKDISEFEKQNNIIIIPPNPTKDERGRWNVIKIPLSQEINNLVGLVRRPVEAAYGQNPIQFSDFAKAILGTVSPVGTDTNSIISTALPQALKPAVQSFSNFNFFTGKQIVPESLTKLSKEKQVFPWTSGSVRQISRILNTSPIKTEQFIKDTFGGVGAQALHYLDKVLAAINVIPKDQISGDDVLNAVSARFTKAQGGQGEQKTIDEIKNLLIKQADKNVELKQKAQKIIEKLDSLPVEEARLRMQELKNGDFILYKKVKDLKEEQVLNLSYEDKLVKQLQVTNGERASFIFSKLEEMSISEQNSFMEEMKTKKIVTKEVLKQLKELKKESMK